MKTKEHPSARPTHCSSNGIKERNHALTSLLSEANHGLDAERASFSDSLSLLCAAVDSGTALELPVLRSPARHSVGSSVKSGRELRERGV